MQYQRYVGILTATAAASGAILYYSHILRAEGRDYSTVIRKTDTADHPRNFKLTVNDATSASTILRTNERSQIVNQGGLISYHFNQVASNSPIEDDHVEAVNASDSKWSFFGLFDGHSGWTTSDKLKRELVPYVLAALKDQSNDTVSAIQSGFVNLDQEIVYNAAETVLKGMPKAEAVQYLMPAMSGSCGLLACYSSGTLHVGVTGDSRAILGTLDGGSCAVRALSEDQTGSTQSEVSRLKVEHPNEEVVRNGRILGGLEPSRAFGDARYKWSSDVQAKISEQFYGRRPPAALLSPPYVTARPEVTSTHLDLTKENFMVLGTDGLYEMLTNEEIAELVCGWRQKFETQSWISTFLRGKISIINTDQSRSGQKSPRQSKKKFVYEDESMQFLLTGLIIDIATHIIRNALGGGDTNRLYGLLSLPYPLSRSYRDDISVTVVFFGGSGKAKL